MEEEIRNRYLCAWAKGMPALDLATVEKVKQEIEKLGIDLNALEGIDTTTLEGFNLGLLDEYDLSSSPLLSQYQESLKGKYLCSWAKSMPVLDLATVEKVKGEVEALGIELDKLEGVDLQTLEGFNLGILDTLDLSSSPLLSQYQESLKGKYLCSWAKSMPVLDLAMVEKVKGEVEALGIKLDKLEGVDLQTLEGFNLGILDRCDLTNSPLLSQYREAANDKK